MQLNGEYCPGCGVAMLTYELQGSKLISVGPKLRQGRPRWSVKSTGGPVLDNSDKQDRTGGEDRPLRAPQQSDR